MIDIVEVSQRSGLAASTLRYYEQRGLITAVGRRGLRRTFEPFVLKRLAMITLARNVGFKLQEIATLFGPHGGDGPDRAMLTAKADELDATINKLSRMRDELRKAAACPASSQLDCPNYSRHLAEASVGDRHTGSGL